ncbi:hypothetical protein [Egicoccus sp. AB-alg2]|uniref:hypothetical protein n=1 Tax=Egicoccus sp. AB-alg2 TaxID=3242693 RepID=UPI00359CE367
MDERSVRGAGESSAALIDRADAEPSAPEPSGHGAAWTATLVRAAVLPLLTTLPLLGIAFRADKRFNIYAFGGEYHGRPWGLLVDTARGVPTYLNNHGNFRPLGRILERSQDLLTFELSFLLALPANVTSRLLGSVSMVALVVLSTLLAAAVASRTPLRAAPPSAVAHLVPLAAAGLLIAAGSQSTVVLFTDMYFSTAAVVVGVALVAVRHGPFERRRLGTGAVVGAFLLGAAMASFNELAYLVAPVAVLAVAGRGLLTLRLSVRDLVASAAGRQLGAGMAGFLAVFVPLRLYIAQRCSVTTCYAQSEVHLSSDVPGVLVNRLGSWLPWSAWDVAVGRTPGNWFLTSRAADLLVWAVIVALAVVMARRASAAPVVGGRALLAVAATGAVTTLSAALLTALSREVQQRALDGWPLGHGWRESNLLLAGVAMVLVAGLLALAGRDRGPRRRAVVAAGTAVLTVVCLVTVSANQTFARAERTSAEPPLHDRIALEMLAFVPTPEGDARRCALLEEFFEVNGNERHHQRLRHAVRNGAQAQWGRPFCEADA